MKYKLLVTKAGKPRKPFKGDTCELSVAPPENMDLSKMKAPKVFICNKPASKLIFNFVEAPICEDCYQRLVVADKIE